MIRALLSLLVLLLPKRVITRGNGSPYLERYYLCGEPGGLKYFPGESIRWWQRALTWLPCVYVHRFRSSDEASELHNHPWSATSLILAGGYFEDRLHGGDPRYPYGVRGSEIVRRVVRPFTINRLAANTFHRVDLIDDDCWTLFVLGSKTQSWGFWSPRTGEFVNHREHAARRRVEASR